MSMTQPQQNQFEDCFEKFMAKQPEDFAYVAKDEAGRWSVAAFIPMLQKLTAAYIQKYNNSPSVSSFDIVLKLGVESGDFKSVAVESEPEVHELTVQEYRSMPVRQIQLKWKNDLVFRAQVQGLIDRGLI